MKRKIMIINTIFQVVSGFPIVLEQKEGLQGKCDDYTHCQEYESLKKEFEDA